MAQTENLSIKVYGRTTTGKNAAFRARLKDRVPAIVYGPKMKAPIPVAVLPADFLVTYRKAGRTGLITLEAAEGAPAELNGTKILVKDIQSHAMKNTLTHVDLHQIDLQRKIRVTVPLAFIGKAKGLAEGGLMSIVSRRVEIKCLPTDIPNHIDVDVSELGVNDSVHVSDLDKQFKGGKFEFVYKSDIALVAVVPPEDEKAPEAVAADATAAAGAAPAAGAAGAKAPAAGAKAPAAPAKK